MTRSQSLAKRPFNHLLSEEGGGSTTSNSGSSTPKLSRSDSLQSLNQHTKDLGLGSRNGSGVSTPVINLEEEEDEDGDRKMKKIKVDMDLTSEGEGDVIVAETKRKKDKGKAKANENENGMEAKGGIWWSDEMEMSKRREQFQLANADIYSALLPGDKGYFAKLVSSYNKSSRPLPTKPVVPYRRLEQPELIAKNAVMKDYQLSGLSFLAYLAENGMNCILADEMGLGKTLQTLSLIAYLAENHGARGPHLLICPLSVLGSWMTEIARWLPGFTAMRFHGPQGERQRLRDEFASKPVDLVVTTYEAFQAEQFFFKGAKKRWGLCVLDEGHRVKNIEAQTSSAVQGVHARMRIILSGTPLQNNLVELWSLLHFLDPQVFHLNSMKPFKDSFDLSAGNYDQQFLKKSQKLLEIIMLRRTKDSVKGQLSVPPRQEMTLYIPLSPAQRFWTRALLARTETTTLSEIFDDFEVKYTSKKGESAAINRKREREERDRAAVLAGGSPIKVDDGENEAHENVKRAIQDSKNKESGGGQWMKLMNLLIQLRKVSSHPYLLPNAEAEPFEVAEHVVAASSKLIALDKMLKEIIPTGERVLIFSGFTRMLDILEDHMHLRGYKYARLDGSTSRPRRALDIKLFQQQKSPYQIYLISTRAGGLGINLTAATTCVMFDSDWNPQVDLQAIARCHRIGQTKTVQVYRLVSQDSVEEQMLSRTRKKLYLSAKVMGSMRNANEDEQNGAEGAEMGTTDDDAPKMTRGELAGILRGGASALAKWTTSDGSDAFESFKAASFADLCERGKERDETKEAGVKAEVGEALTEEQMAALALEEEEAERLLLQGKEMVQSRKFEGQMYKASNAEIQQEWQEVQGKQKRTEQSRTVMIDGHAVSKETARNSRWEAVKTITSDPEALAKLSNTKRTKRAFDHEDFCFACKDGGEVYECRQCPRVFHQQCSGYTKTELKKMMFYTCPQHTCSGCFRNTQEAGGLLFRCQICPDALCEDCLGADDLEIAGTGDTIPELVLLGYGKRAQCFWIRCSGCVEHFAENPKLAKSWRKEQDKIEERAREEGYEG